MKYLSIIYSILLYATTTHAVLQNSIVLDPAIQAKLYFVRNISIHYCREQEIIDAIDDVLEKPSDVYNCITTVLEELKIAKALLRSKLCDLKKIKINGTTDRFLKKELKKFANVEKQLLAKKITLQKVIFLTTQDNSAITPAAKK